MTQLVEIAKKPADEQWALMAQANAAQPPLVLHETRRLRILAKECRASHTELRCVIVLLAAERYRLQHNRWPRSMDELVKTEILSRIPLDPYDGAPLQLRTLGEGILAYSVGPDGTYDGGGGRRRHLIGPMQDISYQLWNVDQRRQVSHSR
jgi:hypothetical protein